MFKAQHNKISRPQPSIEVGMHGQYEPPSDPTILCFHAARGFDSAFGTAAGPAWWKAGLWETQQPGAPNNFGTFCLLSGAGGPGGQLLEELLSK